ncbi:MAG: ABC transporter permease [Minisyncoccia bacterium]
MLFSDLLKETTIAVTANKFRSGLTILGIVIGIGSVIAMVSVGSGSKASIESRIQSMGSNLIYIMPGAARNFSPVSSGRGTASSLKIDDVLAIQKEVDNILNVSPVISRRFQIVSKTSNTNTQVQGVYPQYQVIRNIQIDTGSFFDESQLESYAKVAVLGSTTRDDLFGEGADVVGETIKINGVIFKVIGITQPKGGVSTMEDDVIYIPFTTAQRFLMGNSQYVSAIYVQTESDKIINDVKTAITSLLMQRHNIFDPTALDFSLVTQADILNTASSITNTLTILLASIAGISLIVGGIGIMNMMMTAVNERIREIGLRKAIGAKRREITLQFLMESIILSFVGGVLGIGLGAILAYGISTFASLNTQISLFAVLLACGVSTLIGIIFGYWPAKKAAQLNPIEALRYE